MAHPPLIGLAKQFVSLIFLLPVPPGAKEQQTCSNQTADQTCPHKGEAERLLSKFTLDLQNILNDQLTEAYGCNAKEQEE